MHIRYSCYIGSPDEHPQTVMDNLGIKYQCATPQSIADQWWFWNCTNVPDPLPPFMSVLDLDPQECIGWGLTQTVADRISTRAKELME